MHRSEKELKALAKEYQEQRVPENIDDYILKGIQQAKNEVPPPEQLVATKGANQYGQWFRRLSVAAAILLLSFILTIRYSPVLAHYVGNIPGFERFVQLVHYDKGLLTALEHEHYQPIGLSDTHHDITFTVDHIIVDEGRIIIFHSVKHEQQNRKYSVTGVSLVNNQGEVVVKTASYGMMSEEGTGRLDIAFNDLVHAIPERLTLQVQLREKVQVDQLVAPKDSQSGAAETNNVYEAYPDTTWEISFQVDREKFEGLTQTYHINDTLNIDDQKIHVHQVTIFPTQVAIHLEFDEANTMKLLDLSGLSLLDEKGDTWAGISNGISASHLSETEWIVYLESAYFAYPEELYLQLTEARALPKENAFVTIDLENRALLSAPDPRLNLRDIQEMADEYQIKLSLQKDDRDSLRTYFVVGHHFYDTSGKEYQRVGSSSASGGGDELSMISFYIPKEAYEGNIIFPVEQYPSYIDGYSKIKIY